MIEYVKRTGKKIRQTAPWKMTQREFEVAAARGKIVPATGIKTEAEKIYEKARKGKETALGLGEAAGFSGEDIAHFYIVWQERLGNPEAARIARKWLIQDALKEGKTVPQEILAEFPELLK